MKQIVGRVVANESYGPKCRKLRVALPARAVGYAPGQFFHVRCGLGTDPLLRRPFSVYAVDADDEGWVRHLDFLFTVVGHGTRALAAHAPGDPLDLLGPLGAGFVPPPEPAWHVLVAGGVGIAPFYDLAEYLLKRSQVQGPPSRIAHAGAGGAAAPRITLLFGARTRDELYALRDLESLGIEIRTATDDGTHGRKALVTVVLEELLAEAGEQRREGAEAQRNGGEGERGRGEPGQATGAGLRGGEVARADVDGRPAVSPPPLRASAPLQIYGCGPAPMLDAVTRIVQARGVPCQLSLDRRMGCGLGACGACVCKVRVPDAPEGWNYIRICRLGPVVDAHRLVLDL